MGKVAIDTRFSTSTVKAAASRIALAGKPAARRERLALTGELREEVERDE